MGFDIGFIAQGTFIYGMGFMRFMLFAKFGHFPDGHHGKKFGQYGDNHQHQNKGRYGNGCFYESG